MRAAVASMLSLQAPVRQAAVAGVLADVRSAAGGTAWLGKLA